MRALHTSGSDGVGSVNTTRICVSTTACAGNSWALECDVWGVDRHASSRARVSKFRTSHVNLATVCASFLLWTINLEVRYGSSSLEATASMVSRAFVAGFCVVE